MKIEIIKPNVALSKAYFKQSLNRDDIELFKANLIRMFSRIDDSESEEHNKNIVSDFLKDTFYKTAYEINTAGRKDLVVHLGKSNSDPVGVIIEAKRPDDKAGMINAQKPNAKSVHELIHYYLHERYIKNNKEIRNLIITDIYQWYIFDASEFERHFFNNKQFVKTYKDWHDGVLPSKNTDWFYQEIAKPFIDKEIKQLECTYINLREYETIIKNQDKTDDIKLIHLYKILSPQHLLKLPFANDSNVLNKDFYNELLHIIGLCEKKENGKKTIERLPQKQRNEGSLIENTISIIKTYDKLSNLENPENYGNSIEIQLFSISLELCITWLNRILFLKLLEGQLIKYNNGKQDFAFLNPKTIKDFDELSELFFDVLAVKTDERTQGINNKYSHVPYLNSSLFEISELERQIISINQLKDRFELPIFSSTVFKELSSGVKSHGSKPTLQYLLEFLEAYDFSSENSAVIQEQNKTIINASVLGLIFEKINGYKDGSFFTPGFITMFICKETIQKTVLQKFNTTYNWNCQSIKELYNQLQKPKIEEYNKLINSIRICDPAVGSGHFLVSALNVMIAIKSELGILIDKDGKLLRDYQASVDNDELQITTDSEPFQYNFRNKESQRVQETIFTEKQTIIENCLFGVDINTKSVQICRLRLWIELLKNSYYTEVSNYKELETLPNIDINIKCGNSLVSRFGLNGAGFANGQAQKMKLATQKYKDQVILYKSTTDKATRKKAEKEIERIKEQFSSIANPTDEDFKKLRLKQAELGETPMLFNKDEKTQWEMKVMRLSKEVVELEKAYNEKIKSIYGNAFEWRFEFPEVLDDNGSFVGFDLVIGNPPYYQIQYSDFEFKAIKNNYKTYEATGDIYSLFIEKASQIIQNNSIFSFIVSNRFCNTNYGFSTRKFLSTHNIDTLLNINNVDVFDEANVGTLILIVSKQQAKENNQINLYQFDELKPLEQINKTLEINSIKTNQKYFNEKQWVFKNNEILEIKQKMENSGNPFSSLKDIKINRGITTSANDIFIIDKKLANRFILEDEKNSEILKPVLKGAEIKRYNVIEPLNYIIHSFTNIKIEKYPVIYNYLKKHKSSLSEVYEAKKGQKKWYELRKCSYYADFEKEKLIWTRLSNINAFAISTNKEFSIDSTSFATGKNLKYYCAILNSKAVLFYFKLGSVIWGKDGIKWFGDFFDNIPIPKVSESNQKPLIKLVDKIIELKKSDSKADTSSYEEEIDEIVFKLYGLNSADIKIIDNV
jgi:hypothetical protein